MTKKEKPKLKCNKKTVFIVKASDLEVFIKEFYGREYEIAAGEEEGNDTIVECVVDKKRLCKYDKDCIKKWLDGENVYFLLNDLMDDMYSKGVLENGTYMVDISW